ncbi:MAG: class I SAM-dependent methyltransferase [Thermoplasmata archaeon]|nr:class I SAM-dependent methyltransferase [Thermoplasmata archaeon]
MKREPIGKEDVISTIIEMAIEAGLKEDALDEFLETYAFKMGSLKLLKNLVGADFHLKASINTYEYAFSKHLALEFLNGILETGKSVLSIGCSDGLLEVNLAQKGCKVCGVDTNEKMIDIASRLAKDKDLSKQCRFVTVSGYEYSFSDESFDTILYSHSLHEIDDKIASLRESHRLVRPQGRVIILEDETSREEIIEAVSESGFTIREEKVVLPGRFFNHGLVTSVHAIALEKKQP